MFPASLLIQLLYNLFIKGTANSVVPCSLLINEGQVNDMGDKKKIYTVATAHLDTVWNWDFETTVSKYIYNTLVDNFKLFEKYPTYKFNFEGSYRYELME